MRPVNRDTFTLIVVGTAYVFFMAFGWFAHAAWQSAQPIGRVEVRCIETINP